ncbi:Threonine aldolase [Scheffersomyces spartinae]|uniref:low-specificity L-threonine aldolase n=1 Tax=Scheffersomyces spartinae TaxID=45513 RepID=A0A9P7V8Y9_9ASCO|nr:Threonine aldolase [Scheffersomyces spartinae]KAG7193571.1 Threonine aldolase [Scheffersomyces spartinae]
MTYFEATHNEFRSDTFTVPTQLMMAKAMTNVTWGDSVYKEDEATLQLEEMMCQMTGKPAALFCVSGTLSNQIGLRAHLSLPPYSILCDHRAHVFLHEAAGLATLSQAMVHPVIPANGNYLTVEDIMENYTPDDGDIHAAPTKIVSLENTLHGIITPYEELVKIKQFCKDHSLILHCDGARLWNASAATGVSIAEYCSLFDSVSLCLSKSLGAPMGSILVGEPQFINKANHFKKQNGGGIRQAGFVCNMAMIAIKENFEKLEISHQFAKQVGDFCIANDIYLESPVDTNFVFIDLKRNNMNDMVLIEYARENGLKLMGGRLAFHFQLNQESVDRLKHVLYLTKQESIRKPYTKIIPGKRMYNYDAISTK